MANSTFFWLMLDSCIWLNTCCVRRHRLTMFTLWTNFRLASRFLDCWARLVLFSMAISLTNYSLTGHSWKIVRWGGRGVCWREYIDILWIRWRNLQRVLPTLVKLFGSWQVSSASQNNPTLFLPIQSLHLASSKLILVLFGRSHALCILESIFLPTSQMSTLMTPISLL